MFCSNCGSICTDRYCKNCNFEQSDTETIAEFEIAIENNVIKKEKKGILTEEICKKCGGKLEIIQRQTRAPDESPSEFLICSNCGIKYRHRETI